MDTAFAEPVTIPLPGMKLGRQSQGGTPAPRAENKGDPANQRLNRQQRKIVARERERTAMTMKRQGATYDQIAAALKVSTTGAYKIVQRVLKRIVAKTDWNARVNIAIELQKLEQQSLVMNNLLNNKDTNPDTKLRANEQLLKIADRKAKFLNLDYPDLPQTDAAQDEAARYLAPTLKGASVEQLEELQTVYAKIAANANPPPQALPALPESQRIDPKPESSQPPVPETVTPDGNDRPTAGQTEGRLQGWEDD